MIGVSGAPWALARPARAAKAAPAVVSAVTGRHDRERRGIEPEVESDVDSVVEFRPRDIGVVAPCTMSSPSFPEESPKPTGVRSPRDGQSTLRRRAVEFTRLLGREKRNPAFSPRLIETNQAFPPDARSPATGNPSESVGFDVSRGRSRASRSGTGLRRPPSGAPSSWRFDLRGAGIDRSASEFIRQSSALIVAGRVSAPQGVLTQGTSRHLKAPQGPARHLCGYPRGTAPCQRRRCLGDRQHSSDADHEPASPCGAAARQSSNASSETPSGRLTVCMPPRGLVRFSARPAFQRAPPPALFARPSRRSR